MLRASPLDQPPSLAALLDAGPVALFLDFDGTLVEIATTPDGIEVEDDLGTRLEALSTRLDGCVALISGRSLDDLTAHLGSDFKLACAGSHGAERRSADGSILGTLPQALPEEVIAELRAFANDHGLRYEAKTHGGALHYRENPSAGEASHAFAERLAAEHDLALKTGKCVVELVRKGADKGSAVRAFMEQPPFEGAMPVFVGDDVTDEDGFAACEALGGFGIRVGEPRSTRARFALVSVSQTHIWLGL